MKTIQMAEISLAEDEIQAAVEVLRSGNIRQGKECEAFEREFAAAVGAKFAKACSSGTAALHLACLAALKPGDEVLVPSFTFFATASTVVHAGAKPVFCDVDPATFLIDLADAEKKITDKTRAIAPVHLFGNMVSPSDVRDLADTRGLKVIWDAAQAHGARFDGADVGSFDDMVCYSFYPTKNMFVGEGGMVCTNDPDLDYLLKHLRAHGQTGKYHHEILGLNYRMTDVEAAIGRVQLENLEENLEARRAIAQTILKGLEGAAGIRPQKITPGCEPAWNQFCLTVDPEAFGLDRDGLAQGLKEKGIMTGVHYPKGLHQQPVFTRLYGESSLPATEDLCNRILALPVHPGLSLADPRRIADSIRELGG